MIEKKLHLGELFSFYSPLLTDKQREILALNLEEDYSLGEISEVFHISRQAVNDTVKKAEKAMENYEKKLECVQRMNKRDQFLKDAMALIEKQMDLNHEVLETLKMIFESIKEV